jgi:putative ABC transport system permease protein
MLYGTSPRNPLLLAAACFLIILTAAAAAYLPARHAASIDPMQALRNE